MIETALTFPQVVAQQVLERILVHDAAKQRLQLLQVSA
jgi:hypothetical protein